MRFSGPVRRVYVHIVEQWKNIHALNLSGGFSTPRLDFPRFGTVN